ncbi:MAG: GGGtGRT protein, partial [Deltaproteobacteria bacterium]|nr:GGGtGRT protein [Deltaproteobacteria bacterium]
MALFESFQQRLPQIRPLLDQLAVDRIEAADEVCRGRGVDVRAIVRGVQPICFDDACWAYTLGAALAFEKGEPRAAEIARTLGLGLQAFCIPGSVAGNRQVGLGHGNLAAMLLVEQTDCFAFVAGHESFAAAEGALSLARHANRARTEPLRVILDGMGKDPARIIARIKGFTYVHTFFDHASGELKILDEKSWSTGEPAKVRCYGVDDVLEGVAVLRQEGVDVSITGNSTNAVRFQHLVVGTFKKECLERGLPYFSVASGGGTGRTLHPDN